MDRKKILEDCKEMQERTNKSKLYLDRMVSELEAELTEKPKLRHGDIRQWNGGGCIGIVDLSESTPHLIWDCNDLRSSVRGADILSQSTCIGNIKEIFDDLKAIAEPLTNFKMTESLDDEYTIDGLIVNEAINLKIQTRNNCLTFRFTNQELAKLILNLRRMQHTAEQAKHE